MNQQTRIQPAGPTGDVSRARIDVASLIDLASGDSDGSRRVAQFLLSLWNGHRYRADLQDVIVHRPRRVPCDARAVGLSVPARLAA